MSAELAPSARRVQVALAAAGLEARVVELEQSTRTAQEAAQAVGCEVGQIVKTLVFRRADDGSPLLILASGGNRVDEGSIASALGSPIERADPDFVRSATGFAIGGVPPLGHDRPVATLMDADLLRFPLVWAAAGTPRAVFAVDPAQLQTVTGARVVSLRL
jgi:prolyl-tRNA editing enzyme YbaK/EbsC (Cys-tRNA(Pro) deacylase)